MGGMGDGWIWLGWVWWILRRAILAMGGDLGVIGGASQDQRLVWFGGIGLNWWIWFGLVDMVWFGLVE